MEAILRQTLIDVVPIILPRKNHSTVSFIMHQQQWKFLGTTHRYNIFTEFNYHNTKICIVWVYDSLECLLDTDWQLLELAKQTYFLRSAEYYKIARLSCLVESNELINYIERALDRLLFCQRNFHFYYSHHELYGFIKDRKITKNQAREILYHDLNVLAK